MYLTAQRVQSRDGTQDIHAFLHLHDVVPFPQDPFCVPQSQPGRLVLHDRHLLSGGGNTVLAFLDIVADDASWETAIPPWSSSSTKAWFEILAPFAELAGNPPPWVFQSGPAFVIFNSLALPVNDYPVLLESALRLWERWRSERNLR